MGPCSGAWSRSARGHGRRPGRGRGSARCARCRRRCHTGHGPPDLVEAAPTLPGDPGARLPPASSTATTARRRRSLTSIRYDSVSWRTEMCARTQPVHTHPRLPDQEHAAAHDEAPSSPTPTPEQTGGGEPRGRPTPHHPCLDQQLTSTEQRPRALSTQRRLAYGASKNASAQGCSRATARAHLLRVCR